MQEAMTVGLEGLDHVGLVVTDIPRSVRCPWPSVGECDVDA
jgi:hypothetical protein